MKKLAPLGVAAAALLATATFAAGSLWLGGYDPVAAAGAMVRGAVGSPSAILSITMVRSVPLILTGLAVALAFRAGVWNIGLGEGDDHRRLAPHAGMADQGGQRPRLGDQLIDAVEAVVEHPAQIRR